jgi:hypothetical protein
MKSTTNFWPLFSWKLHKLYRFLVLKKRIQPARKFLIHKTARNPRLKYNTIFVWRLSSRVQKWIRNEFLGIRIYLGYVLSSDTSLKLGHVKKMTESRSNFWPFLVENCLPQNCQKKTMAYLYKKISCEGWAPGCRRPRVWWRTGWSWPTGRWTGPPLPSWRLSETLPTCASKTIGILSFVDGNFFEFFHSGSGSRLFLKLR